MQPEDILLYKEWFQLSGEEKILIQELAADEQEFNLVKKMLSVAMDEEVPAINPSLQQQIALAISQPKQRSIYKWYYAAAAVLLVALCSTWFIVTQHTSETPGVAVIPAHVPAVTPVTPLTDTVQQQPITAVRKPRKTTTPPSQKKTTTSPAPADANTAPALPTVAFTAMRVKDNTELLSLVTEIY
jgi:hypothetical protein